MEPSGQFHAPAALPCPSRLKRPPYTLTVTLGGPPVGLDTVRKQIPYISRDTNASRLLSWPFILLTEVSQLWLTPTRYIFTLLR
jgi:hypothetical protein